MMIPKAIAVESYSSNIIIDFENGDDLLIPVDNIEYIEMIKKHNELNEHEYKIWLKCGRSTEFRYGLGVHLAYTEAYDKRKV